METFIENYKPSKSTQECVESMNNIIASLKVQELKISSPGGKRHLEPERLPDEILSNFQ